MKPPFDIAARQAAIVDQPPRIQPLRPDQLGSESRETMNGIRAALGLPPSDGVISDAHTATMLKVPDLFKAHMGLALYLFKGALTPRDRELAVLRIGWLCGAPYEWGEHVKIAKRVAGVTDAEILQAQEGSDAAGWSEHDRAVIRAVEELMSVAMISDATWATLAKTLSEAQLIELPILVGQYMGVAFAQNSIRVRLLDGNAGLNQR